MLMLMPAFICAPSDVSAPACTVARLCLASMHTARRDRPDMQTPFVLTCVFLPAGSWEKTVKYWDIRSPTPTAVAKLPDRVHAMDVKNPMLVVGCADRNFYMYDLHNPMKPYATRPSPLKLQSRCVSVFPGVPHRELQHLPAVWHHGWWLSCICSRECVQL